MPRPKRYASRAERQRAYRLRLRAKELPAENAPSHAGIPTRPSLARWKAILEQVEQVLRKVRDEMQTYFDDRSESWQESERGETFLERIEAVEAALDSLSEAY